MLLKKNKNDHVYLVIFTYWITLIIWQVFRSVGNRSTVDIFIKVGLIVMLMFYAINKSKNFTISLEKLLILLTYIICQITTFSLNEPRLSFSVLVTPLFSIVSVLIFIIILDEQELGPSSLSAFLNLFISSVFVMAIYNCIILWSEFSRILTISSAYGNEMSSFLVSNHEFALYLILGIVACLISTQITNRQKKNTKKYYFCIMLFVINLISTFSRTSMLSLALCIAVMLFFLRKRTFIKFSILSIVTILIIMANPNINQYVMSIILKGNTTAGRIDLMEYGIEIFKNLDIIKMVFGIGYSNTIIAANITTGNSSFHNGYLTILLNGGIMMFTFFLIIVISSLNNAIKCMKFDMFYGSAFLGLIILMLVYMVTATPIPFFSSLDSFTITIFTIVLPKYYYNYLKNSKEQKEC